jgi:hypothetical protein
MLPTNARFAPATSGVATTRAQPSNAMMAAAERNGVEWFDDTSRLEGS